MDDDVEDNITLHTSPYYSHDTFVESLENHQRRFSVLSLNCQSLNAKFNKLLILIEELRQNNFKFSVICLQETWLEEGADTKQFYIPNYTCISQGKYWSKHGGLVTYIHQRCIYNLVYNKNTTYQLNQIYGKG